MWDALQPTGLTKALLTRPIGIGLGMRMLKFLLLIRKSLYLSSALEDSSLMILSIKLKRIKYSLFLIEYSKTANIRENIKNRAFKHLYFASKRFIMFTAINTYVQRQRKPNTENPFSFFKLV